MMSSELVTMVQERIKVIVVLINNHGFASIGGLLASVGSAGFGTRYRHRDEDDQLEGEVVQVDFATNMESFGAKVIRTHNKAELVDALRVAKAHEGGPICIYIEADREQRVEDMNRGGMLPLPKCPITPKFSRHTPLTARRNKKNVTSCKQVAVAPPV
jgi:TPP-dependent trihydroxycyclohexane-1,2-dione (THcHDO) dehydratase